TFADGSAQVHMVARESLPTGTVEIGVEQDPQLDEYLPPRYFLHMLRGAPAYGIFAIGENTIVGRSESADVFLLDPGISRVHARIEIRDGVATISDCGSTNGSFVNGERIERCELRDGDRLSFGDTELRVEIRD
ncbi:MAG TPA: FHA domain-containing protein, partial [Candidatus Dormibacteraeota bacterium]|nr:FHA domain-containing protein [Candidatus Dormibacteraeota bacterium]